MKIKDFAKKIVFATGIIPDGDSQREKWIRNKLAKFVSGKSIIDIGAGEMIYKSACQHLLYTSQDFGEYTGKNSDEGLQTGKFDTSKIDIISDITKIPVKSASFDYVLCAEVFEHIPDPLAALKEIQRIHREGGTLILTAPHCSLTHFHPYYFYSGFSKEFYKTVLPKLGYKIISLETNGNYFTWISSEIIRMPTVVLKYSKIGFLIAIPIFLLSIPLLLGMKIAGKLFPSSSDLLWGDTFIEAIKETPSQ